MSEKEFAAAVRKELARLETLRPRMGKMPPELFRSQRIPIAFKIHPESST